MKVFTQFLIKVSLMVAGVLLTSVSYGAVFTATASGDFSSSTTWLGGIVPPTTLTSDVIVIPLGITVNLDEALTIDGPAAQLDVNGSLVTDANASLMMVEGVLSGTGTISLNSIDLNAGTAFLFTGMMNVKDLNVDATIATTADMAIEETLTLQSGDMSLTGGGSLSFSPDARLMLSGGTLTLGAGGSIDLSTDYSVRYNGSSFTSGIELSGSGLKDLEVNMGEGNTLTLSSDVTLGGKLALDGGTLALADQDLVINGDVTSSTSGKISSTALSDITLNALSSTTGSLTFEAASELNDLIINLPPEYAAKIEGFLSVQGDLMLNSGILKMDNADISINGDITGTGMLSATPATNLIINTTGELSTALRFDTEGQTLNNFSVSVGAGNELTLDSDLTVKGDLAVMGESILKINSTSLTLDTESTLSGSGKLAVDGSSSLTINSTAGIDALRLDGMIGDLTINTSETSTVNLASDATVSGMLTLQSGTMMLNDFDLAVMGDVAASGTGKVYATSASDVTFSSGTSGILTFDAGSVVKSLTVDAGADVNVKISGDVTIDSLLKLTSGIMHMSDASLTINGDITGGGMFSSTNADMTINTTTGLSESLRFDADGQTLNSLTIDVGENNSVQLGTDLSIDAMLNLSDGSVLDISGKSLVLDSESNLIGTGSLDADASSSLTINSTADISSLKLDGMIGGLTINTDASSTVSLASDAQIAGMLTLQSGTMMVNDFNLIILGDISASGTGEVFTTSLSNVNISSGTSGALTFGDGSLVKTLTIDAGATSTSRISGDVAIDSLLKISSGIMQMIDANVTINGDLTGAGILSSTNADLTINSTTGLSESLRFAADGQTLNSLTIDVGENNKVELGSDLTIDAMLNLTDGSILDISGKSLILESGSNLTGTGALEVDAASSLTVNSNTDISSLKMVGTVGDFTLNTGNGSVMLTSDAVIDGTFTMGSGVLNLNNNDLSVYGNISATGTGTLSTTADSDIKIETNTSTAGALRFSSTANTVGDMTVKIADNGSVAVETDLTIAKSLNLQGGTLNINDQTMVMGSTSTIVGASPTSYIRTDAGGEVEMEVIAGGSTVIFPVGTVNAYAPAEVSLNAGSESGKIQVGVSADVFAEGSVGADLSATEPLVDATWQVQSDIATGLDMNLRVMWPSSIEVNGFDRTDAFISNYINGEWDSSARASATAESNGMFSMERTGLTSIGAYAVFDANTVTATEDVTDDFKLRIYPNPAVESIIIQNTTPSTGHVNMEIISATGQLMGQYRLIEANTTISVKELTHGQYFIRFYNKDLSSTKQFTKI